MYLYYRRYTVRQFTSTAMVTTEYVKKIFQPLMQGDGQHSSIMSPKVYPGEKLKLMIPSQAITIRNSNSFQKKIRRLSEATEPIKMDVVMFW